MNRMAGPEAWAAMKACFVFMSSPPIEQKKPRLCAEPQPPPSAACYPGECCASSAASAFCAAVEPAASSSSRQVFNCVGVTPSSAATLLCVAPGSDSRATACSLYSGRKPPPRLLCHPVPPGRYLIYRLVRDPGATSGKRAVLRSGAFVATITRRHQVALCCPTYNAQRRAIGVPYFLALRI